MPKTLVDVLPGNGLRAVGVVAPGAHSTAVLPEDPTTSPPSLMPMATLDVMPGDVLSVVGVVAPGAHSTAF
jgi:hypothetical protein